MADRRQRDVNWLVCDEKGQILGVEHAMLAVLMDIRERLHPLRCSQFLDIPERLRRIEKAIDRGRRPCHRKHAPPARRRA